MLYHRGRSYWYRFKWTVKNEHGQSETLVIRRTARTASKREARNVMEDHRRALRLGLVHPTDPWPRPPAPEAPRLRDFAFRFLQHAEQQTKASTARFYAECLQRVLKFMPLAEGKLTDITGETVTKYSKWRRSMPRGNSVATINTELRTLRRLFKLAEEWGILAKAPQVHELPGQKARDRVLSFEEEAAYLGEASTTLRDVTILAVDTGICPDSELFPLEWGNTRLEPGPGAPYGLIHIAQGKTEYRRRNVSLTPRAQAVLEMRRAVCGHSQYVFPGNGRSGHLTSIQHPHVTAIRKADLKAFEFYCWRHTFGTRCAESGMDKFSLARLMGHSSPRIAERYYVHVTEPHVTAGFERFLDYLANQQIESFPGKTKTVQ